ncbi:MAG: hypothetical protein A2173_05950 [Planctomycetes bacterium RBG_13_44_8b]|nr:MAG: hypothetical protein A2173_05950 [Planctomycetes bacterium RBG_13_44_8b]
MQEKTGKNGFVLLAILLVVVIIAMLYLANLRGLLGPDMDRAGSPYDERPWFEEQRLLDKNAFPVIQKGKNGKVVIEEKTILNAEVQRQTEDRGQLQIIIEPNGLAKGLWQCSYEYPNDSYTITAAFTGNIDPTKIYQNEAGKNPQLLYLITKGKYRQIKTDKKTGYQWPTEQIIYVVGWLDNDCSAKGKLFLMADDDEETYGNAEYDWQTK